MSGTTPQDALEQATAERRLPEEGRKISPRRVTRVPMSARDTAWRVLIVVLVALLWEGAVRVGVLDRLWVSQPTTIFAWLVEHVQTPRFWTSTALTVWETFLGLAIGAVLGAIIGFLLSLSSSVYRVNEPFLMALYSLPRVALAPLFILWFGIDSSSKVALAVSLVMFVMIFAARDGVRSVAPELSDCVRTMTASRWFLYRRVVIPSSMPFLMSGLRVSLGLSLIGVIVGEMIAARAGLGYDLAQAANLFQTHAVFAIIVVLGVIALAGNSLLSALERILLPWARSREE